MLAFVTSLRHPQNSADYGRVELLLEQTLASVAAQHGDDFVVIVVGNRRPAFELPRRTHFVEVDFPAPAPPTGPRTDRDAFVWDKGTKIGAGLIAAREYSPDYVMIFDADDYVSNRLAAFVASAPPSPGWVVSSGWMYSYTREVAKPINGFNRTCGTSFIMSFDAYQVPNLPEGSTQREIADGFGERLYSVLGAHRHAREWFAEHSFAPVDLPFRGAVYNVDTGENHSGKALSGIAFNAGRALVTEYGLPVRLSAMRRLWNAIGARAIAETLASRLRRLASR
ncbi:glycosyltransferase family A protein [Microbacterium sp. BG28]|uniref:glycosyltransferase family A protein n=1 Tax=Microbacterium sp. BG28 TaxID=3097356 RepID=UPI002A5A3938|nr:glycosyltransferase family A protein [Microbacterium sp. BG28]MDY0830150.1 glycosyltransferase family A protein [Microbacterium sp. BG28]